MNYILKAQALASLMKIRAEYEEVKGIKLDKKPSFFGIPTQIGGTDIKTRNKQISFLESMYGVLEEHLLPPEKLTTEEAYRVNLTASQMMVAVCLFIEWQVEGTYMVRSKLNSTLARMIHDKLGISSTNFLDSEDLDLCFETASALLALPGAFTEANQTLGKKNKNLIDRTEWNEFKEFIKNQQKSAKKSTNYPITSYTRPIFGSIFGYAGASIGLNAGNTISNSTKLNTTRYYLTAGISGIILTVGGAGTMGVSIIAPVIATKLVESFCQVSLGHIGAITLKYAGEGVGIAIGLPLDLALKLTTKSFGVLKDWMTQEKDRTGLTGIRIADGMPVVAGLVIKVSQHAEDSRDLIVELELNDLVQESGFQDAANHEIVDLYPLMNNNSCNV